MVTVNKNFWSGKTVLLTGHSGFKGSWLSIWLKMLKVNLIGYSLYIPSSPNLFEIASVANGLVSINGDIRDFKALKETIKKYKPEIIIHMAAQSLVHKSYKEPVETYETNIMGTVNVLEAAKQVGNTKVILNVTSDKCYENKEQVWGYRENEPMGGYDPYSSSKGCAELVTAAYRNSFFNPSEYSKHGTVIATARAGNVIGGGDWADNRIIPDIIRAIWKNESIRIRNPGAIRPWQHVLEPISGYLILIEKLWENNCKYSGGWNFGPLDEDSKSVSYIVNHFTKIWGETIPCEIDKTNKLHEATFLKLDISKALSFLNWSPKWKINEALKKTIEWYKAYRDKEDMNLFSTMQIKDYEETSSKEKESLMV